MGIIDNLKNIFTSEETDELVDRFPQKVGSYGFDAWGYNAKGVKSLLGLGKQLHEKYFRVEAHGLENVPKELSLIHI